ncbi:hypothetical protein C8J56DRAFT_898909 [Mycena floridula]|nr:hypothetical protein C8J56DRAFT_898909 [Mycena floridula]
MTKPPQQEILNSSQFIQQTVIYSKVGCNNKNIRYKKYRLVILVSGPALNDLEVEIVMEEEEGYADDIQVEEQELVLLLGYLGSSCWKFERGRSCDMRVDLKQYCCIRTIAILSSEGAKFASHYSRRNPYPNLFKRLVSTQEKRFVQQWVLTLNEALSNQKPVVVVYLSLARRDANVSLSELYGSRDLLWYQRGPAWGEIFSSRTGLLERPGFSGLDKGIMPLAISESRQPVNRELTLLGAIGGKGASKPVIDIDYEMGDSNAGKGKQFRGRKRQAVESRTEVAQAWSGRAMRDVVSYLKKAGLVTEKTKTIVNHSSTGCQTNRQEVS